VKLHVLEELLAMLHISDSEVESPTVDVEVFEDNITDAQEVHISISEQAINGSEAPCSMRD
jgi:hypothetical protein